MAEAKHTPGPWKIADLHRTGMYMNSGATVIMAEDDGTGIGEIRCQADFKRGEGYKAQCPERDANARLIAAAPELLDAALPLLAEISEYLPSAGEDNDEWVTVRLGDLKALQRAAAKATGEQA